MAAIAINCDADSKQGLQLVAAAAGLSAAASFAPTEGAPTAIASDGKPTRGLNPVARVIAGSAAKGVAANLLGASPEEQAAVRPSPLYCPFSAPSSTSGGEQRPASLSLVPPYLP
jgi:hypothetical protein